jgi:hypothetical protein
MFTLEGLTGKEALQSQSKQGCSPDFGKQPRLTTHFIYSQKKSTKKQCTK